MGAFFLRSGSSDPMEQTDFFSEAFGALQDLCVEHKKVMLHWDRSNMAFPHELKIVCYSNFSQFKQTISLLFGASRFLHLELVFSGIWSAPMEPLLKKTHPLDVFKYYVPLSLQDPSCNTMLRFTKRMQPTFEEWLLYRSGLGRGWPTRKLV